MNRPFVALAVASALVLAGCGGASESELLRQARQKLEQRDPKAAVIQLKNALQQNPQSGEARWLLGEALLDAGDAKAASVEFGKAADLRYDPNRVMPGLARAMLELGETKKLVDLYATTKLADPQAQAAFQVSLAAAYFVGNDVTRGEQTLKAAEQAAPKLAAVRLMRSRLQAIQGDYDGAAASIDAVIGDQPDHAEAHQLKGDLLIRFDKDPKLALAAFRRAVEIRPDRMLAHLGAVTAAMRLNDEGAIKAQFEQMSKAFPQHPETKFIGAQIAFLAKDYKKAREDLLQLLRIAPDNSRLLTLAGAIDYQTGSLLQAEASLSKALKLSPQASLTRRLLGTTYVRMGKSDRAIATLAPAVEERGADVETLSIAAEAYLQAGDYRQADELLRRASKQSPNDPSIRTALAVSEVAKGNAAAGFAELQAVAKADAGTTADLALVAAHLRRNETKEALAAIDSLEKKQPDRPFAAFMRARVMQMRDDVPAARAELERALKIDPRYFAAVTSLAALDMIESKPDTAARRFEEFAKLDPKNYQPKVALAEVRKRAGAKPPEVAALLQEAIKTSPAEAAPRVALVNLYIGARDAKAAQQAAQEASAALPDNLDVLDAVGRAYFLAGDMNQSIATFKRLSNAAPQMVQPHLRLADAYVVLKDTKSAIASLRRALELSPDLAVAQRGIMQLSLGARQPQDALEISRAIQRQRPAEPMGYLFEGDIEMARKNWSAAVAAYRKGIERAPMTEVAIKLRKSLQNLGQAAEAEKVAVDWERRFPKDAAFTFMRADEAMAQQNWALAEQRFRSVVELKPKDPVAMNNLAWLLLKQRKPGALPLAQKANELLPDRAQVLDTLALAYAEDKQYDKAVAAASRAVQLIPDDYGLRLNLARIRVAAGDKDTARAELDRLAKLGPSLPQHAEVRALLDSLKN